MRKVLAKSLLAVLVLSSGWPLTSHASNVDLAITAGSIRFSEETLYAGDTVRIYATIRNKGDTDSTAQVFFYQSDRLIGGSQPVSVIADGGGDDVFVDFKLPEGSFNIRAVIQGADPADTNSSNDVAITPLFKTISDDDRDGVMNDKDNCVDEKNEDQANLDNDGKGDACDKDMDNDGVLNVDDEFPRDASKSKKEVAPTPIVKAAEDEVEPTPAPTQTSSIPSTSSTSVTDSQTSSTSSVSEPSPAAEEPTVVALDLSDIGSGGPQTSPSARFTIEQKNWHTYEFVVIPVLGDKTSTYAWDFGDGATSVQPSIKHTFASSGAFTVTLASVDAAGKVTTDSQEIEISFFHLSNPLLLATIGALVMILVGLFALIIKLRRGEEV